ncbi:MAG: hypothetical protein ACD_34C00322G0004 [uncultured bacterium]|nr:MAG: hypothetical protein ACD_34C00322G0004 [uncultured bacterium]
MESFLLIMLFQKEATSYASGNIAPNPTTAIAF